MLESHLYQLRVSLFYNIQKFFIMKISTHFGVKKFYIVKEISYLESLSSLFLSIDSFILTHIKDLKIIYGFLLSISAIIVIP